MIFSSDVYGELKGYQIIVVVNGGWAEIRILLAQPRAKFTTDVLVRFVVVYPERLCGRLIRGEGECPGAGRCVGEKYVWAYWPSMGLPVA